MRANLRSFTSLYTAVVSAALLLCIILGVLLTIQGPRIRKATLTTLSGQSQHLDLLFNQQIGTVSDSQVRLSPRAAYRVSSGGTRVAVQFTEPLKAGQAYVLRMQLAGRSVSHTFTTPALQAYYVRQSPTGQDEIRRRIIGGTATDATVYKAETIVEYATLGTSLAVVTQRSLQSHELHLYDILTKEDKLVPLPADGLISRLRVAANDAEFGFIFAARDEVVGRLLVHRLDASEPKVVRGYRGQSIAVRDWLYVPGKEAVVVQQYDTSVLIIDPRQPEPLPLGQIGQLKGFSHDAKKLVATLDGDEVIAFDLATGLREPYLRQPLDKSYYFNAIYPLRGQAGYVLGVQQSQLNTSKQLLQYVPATGKQHLIYQAKNPDTIIGRSVLSPNDQYLAVGITGSFGGGVTQQTKLLDVRSGEELATLPGTLAAWDVEEDQ